MEKTLKILQIGKRENSINEDQIRQVLVKMELQNHVNTIPGDEKYDDILIIGPNSKIAVDTAKFLNGHKHRVHEVVVNPQTKKVERLIRWIPK